MRVALVHDDLVQWGGAERVLIALSEIFPEAPIYTSLYNRKNKILREKLTGKKVVTSFLQKIPGSLSAYKALLPLYPIAFEQFDFSGFDLVISHTTRFAKSIITKPETVHVCYCHTPPRFLWNLSGEEVPGWIQPYFSFLRSYDLASSKRVDFWVAGSENAKNRLKKIYDVDSKVIYPFLDLQRFAGLSTFDGGYYLVITRLNKYKRVDLAIEAANKLKFQLKIVGSGPDIQRLMEMAGPGVEFLGMVDEGDLALLLAGCKALIIDGEEDFGLTSLEAQAVGKPVVAYKAGGSLESVLDGETGYFFKEQTAEGLIWALKKLDKDGYNKTKCLDQASRFSKAKFNERFRGFVSKLPLTH